MASNSLDEATHKQSFSIDDLAARSVTLYPTRAAVVRDIENVTIEPGHNEITIHNLTPQADEHSIKVEGHGTDALITDMTVDLVPNYRYTSSTDDDSDDELEEEAPKNAGLEQLKENIKVLRLQLEDADESRTSAMKQLTFLDQHVETLTHAPGTTESVVPSVSTMSENLNGYATQREKIYSAFKEAQAVCVKLTEDIKEKSEKQAKVQTGWEKSLRKADKAKEQVNRQKLHERRERQEQQLEVPRFVYRIRITIESECLPANTHVVPASVATGKPARKEDDEPPPDSTGPSLRISYITSGASWTPRYDLRLDTISGTGTLTYRAHFFNRTGEIWRNAKLTLSTSQTSFSGLEDKVPWMDSWRITLRKRGTYGAEKDGGLYSQKEKDAKEEKLKKMKEELGKVTDHKNAVVKFEEPKEPMHEIPPPPGAPAAMVKFGQSTQMSQNQLQVSSKPFMGSAAPVAEELHILDSGETSHRYLHTLQHGHRLDAIGGLGQLTDARKNFKRSSWGGIRIGSSSAASASINPYDSEPSDEEDEDDATLNPPQKMGLAASGSESYGLTTTYDLPGLRTIPPSKLVRRHVITEITLPSVEFSHISVPKLRAAAFLKARIRNPSNTPLLRGPAGLTLDGSFLGNSTIPRCAPDEYFELGLGVDEEVHVEYRKPVRKVASMGMLVKEQVVTYERCARIHNARGNPVKLVLFDQVPVSEDERLRITISRPRGLKSAGDAVKVAGSGNTLLGSVGNAKSPAVPAGSSAAYVQAEMRKGGEIRWEVSVEGGKDAVLPLEYEARLPGGEVIFGL